MIRVSWSVRALLLPLLISGCAGGDRETSLVEVRDSAGIEVVHARGPQWEEGGGWSTSSEPSLVIGKTEGDDSEVLYRVSSAVRLESSHILITQSSNPPHFRIYDSVGAHLRSFGTAGEGPGEFRLVATTCVRGDTILAYDPILGRLTALTPEGEVSSVRTMPRVISEGGARTDVPVWMDAFEDCDFLGRANSVAPPEAGPATFAWWRLELEDLRQDTIVVVSGGSWTAPRVAVRFVSFPWAVAADTTVFISSDGDFWVAEYTRTGRLVRRFGRDHEPIPIDAGDLQRLRDSEQQRSHAYAEHWPAHTRRMIVDRTGHLWLNHFVRPWDEPPDEKWTVFDPNGVFLGVVETPRSLRITEIGGDYVLGIWTDGLGVESVRLFDLDRGQGDVPVRHGTYVR